MREGAVYYFVILVRLVARKVDIRRSRKSYYKYGNNVTTQEQTKPIYIYNRVYAFSFRRSYVDIDSVNESCTRVTVQNASTAQNDFSCFPVAICYSFRTTSETLIGPRRALSKHFWSWDMTRCPNGIRNFGQERRPRATSTGVLRYYLRPCHTELRIIVRKRIFRKFSIISVFAFLLSVGNYAFI